VNIPQLFIFHCEPFCGLKISQLGNIDRNVSVEHPASTSRWSAPPGLTTFTSSKHREQAHWFLKRSAERKPLRICTFPFSGGYSVPTYIDIHIFFPSRYVFMNASAGPNLNVSAKGKKNQRYFTPFFGREVCDSYFFCLSKSLIFLSPGSVWLIISGAECVWSLTNKPTDPPSLSLSPSL
jgi:hypothetical protein